MYTWNYSKEINSKTSPLSSSISKSVESIPKKRISKHSTTTEYRKISAQPISPHFLSKVNGTHHQSRIAMDPDPERNEGSFRPKLKEGLPLKTYKSLNKHQPMNNLVKTPDRLKGITRDSMRNSRIYHSQKYARIRHPDLIPYPQVSVLTETSDLSKALEMSRKLRDEIANVKPSVREPSPALSASSGHSSPPAQIDSEEHHETFLARSDIPEPSPLKRTDDYNTQKRLSGPLDAITMKFSNLVTERELRLVGESELTLDIKSVSFNDQDPIRSTRPAPLTLNISKAPHYIYFAFNDKKIENYVLKVSMHLEKIYFSDHSILIHLKNNLGYFLVKHSGGDERIRDYFKNNPRADLTTKTDEEIKKRTLIIEKTIGDNDVILNDTFDFASSSSSLNPAPLEVEDSLPYGFANSKLKADIKKADPFSSLNMRGIRSTRSRTTTGVAILEPDVYGRAYYDVGKSSKKPISIPDESSSRLNGTANADDVVEREEPAPFTPDLNYPFLSKKKITITSNDFKTLYNNEWINDTVIDFFIEYEIEQACKNKALGLDPDSILAFNSFFFTKLMSNGVKTSESKASTPIKAQTTSKSSTPIGKKELSEGVDTAPEKDTSVPATSVETNTPNYYQNIKRWLSKVDFMKHPYVIMPINDGYHWYCCIIRDLPTLLEEAQKGDTQVGDSQDSNSSYDSSNNGKSSKKKRKLAKPKHFAEIFMFDSFDYKHTNLNYPLTKFIIDYCKDKYDVDVLKEQIKITRAKVPLQDNFNDCGIHVIYNVRQWLNNIPKCERLWRRAGRKTDVGALRGITAGEASPTNSELREQLYDEADRNGMRKTLIAILLDLHDKQTKGANHLQQGKIEHKEDEDDDVEVLEAMPQDQSGVQEQQEEVRNPLDPKARKLLNLHEPLGEAIQEDSKVSLPNLARKEEILPHVVLHSSEDSNRSLPSITPISGSSDISKETPEPGLVEKSDSSGSESIEFPRSILLESQEAAELSEVPSITEEELEDKTDEGIQSLRQVSDVQLIEELLSRDMSAEQMSSLFYGTLKKMAPNKNNHKSKEVFEFLRELVSDLLPVYKDSEDDLQRVNKHSQEISRILSQTESVLSDSPIRVVQSADGIEDSVDGVSQLRISSRGHGKNYMEYISGHGKEVIEVVDSGSSRLPGSSPRSVDYDDDEVSIVEPQESIEDLKRDNSSVMITKYSLKGAAKKRKVH